MHYRRPVESSGVTLPVTPMLDMTFQLLFFFIVNFHPADLEGQVDASLPGKGDVVQGPAPGGDPAELAIPADLTVRVRARQDGVAGISAISVRGLAGKDEPVADLTALRNALARRREDGLRGPVRVEGEGSLPVRSVLAVLDACRQAGYDDVGLAVAGR
jgi:biopolymer transport protein ExbD